MADNDPFTFTLYATTGLKSEQISAKPNFKIINNGNQRI